MWDFDERIYWTKLIWGSEIRLAIVFFGFYVKIKISQISENKFSINITDNFDALIRLHEHTFYWSLIEKENTKLKLLTDVQ